MTLDTGLTAAQWLESQQPDMLALLADIVNIDSNSYDKPGVARVFRRLESFFSSHGLTVASHYAGNVEAAISVTANRGSAVGKPVLLMGHCDTVFPAGEAARRPFRIEAGRAYGPGVADMKSGIVMNAFLLAAIARSGDAAPEVTGLFTCDEEIGSPLSKDAITAFGKQAGFVFNAEPGRPSGNVVTGRKGGVFFNMEIEGKAAHSGANFAEGISAISELAHKVVALDALTDIDAGVTVNVGLVNGGLSVNTSAPSASAAIDLRIFNLEQRESLVGSIRCICNKSFITGTLSKLDITGEFKPFVPTAQSRKLFELYQAELGAIGHKAEAEFSGGCADSGVTSSLGAITLCGTGPVGGKFHTLDEYCEVGTIVPRGQAVLNTILRLSHTQW
ncbi:M20 family metallopeptidase [Achromobacter sp. NPDC058515]|uniref:M20 family metallopeptidase n=1 Tax=Achromobacter sp. NPDC058515 TaxID=3346533 RepID=UPI00364B5197